MAALRSLLYAALFYAGTTLWVLAGVLASLFGRRPTLAVVLSWADLNHWLATNVLGIRTKVDGVIPDGPYLIAVKHETMLETTEMIRLSKLPVIVIKRELADIPLFGFLTRQYGVIPVERSAGAKALREMVAAGKDAVESRTAGDDISGGDARSRPARRRRCGQASPGSIERSACRSSRWQWTVDACGAGARSPVGNGHVQGRRSHPRRPEARGDRDTCARRDQCPSS